MQGVSRDPKKSPGCANWFKNKSSVVEFQKRCKKQRAITIRVIIIICYDLFLQFKHLPLGLNVRRHIAVVLMYYLCMYETRFPFFNRYYFQGVLSVSFLSNIIIRHISWVFFFTKFTY